jgi:ATP-dependent DNA ligase
MTFALPFQPPLAPMLAKLCEALPDTDGWLFEPKWDGFRALVFKSGSELLIQSRDLKPLGRYFPEVEQALKLHLPERCVLDGEVVLARDGRLDFEALQLRLHPAASRVKLLAQSTPCAFVAWDLLALFDEDLRELPQLERRARLLEALSSAKPPVHVTPATRDRALAADWFRRFEGAGLDGVVAKPVGLTYRPDKRAMLKIKHQRTADCVVAGFRWFKGGKGTLLGSLVLALYDSAGALLPVGVCGAFTRQRRAELVAELEPYREGAEASHPWKEWIDAPAEPRRIGTSRWNPDKELSWEPLKLGLVAEVSYDHMQGRRFRHAAQFRRFRPDKAPAECRFDQLEVTAPHELQQIFGERG